MSLLGKKSAIARHHSHKGHVGRVWCEVVGAGLGTSAGTKLSLGLLLAGVWLSATAQEPQNPRRQATGHLPRSG